MISLLALLLTQPADTLFVTVNAPVVGHSVIMEAVPGDSSVLLPGSDLASYLQLPIQPGWISTRELESRFRLTVQWIPSQLTVYILDPYNVLPVMQRRIDDDRTRALNRPAVSPYRSGFYGWVATEQYPNGDARENNAGMLGYSFKGRFQMQVQQSSKTDTRASVYLNPFRGVWTAYQWSPQGQSGTGSLNLGNWWSIVSYTPDHPVRYATAYSLFRSHVIVYGNNDEQYAVTVRTDGGGGMQIGYDHKKVVGRFSFGVVPVSPFSIPTVP